MTVSRVFFILRIAGVINSCCLPCRAKLRSLDKIYAKIYSATVRKLFHYCKLWKVMTNWITQIELSN